MKNQFTKQLLRFVIIILIQVFGFLQVNAQTETIPTGSFIVNMGNTNIASINDDVKPYGMMYDLMLNHNVPIKWVITPGKIKDGADFTHNGIVYKGGTFIVPAGFRTATVNARISFWQTQGVVGATSVADFTATVFKTLTSVPRWTLDAGNGGIAQGYLTAAGITLTTFPNAYNWKAVGALDCCDDFFVMPHADPTWATHNRLFSWNKDCLGSIWAACHAVSALENSINTTNPAEQMNFLSTRTAYQPTGITWPNNSLKLWGKHSGGSVPYTHTLFDDPVAQYMGVTDLSQLNGSEQIYIPKQTGDAAPAGGPTRWRPGAKIIAYDATQADVPSPDYANGNVAAVIVYGRGLDDPTRGYVMYEAGHSHMKGTTSDGPALRAFLNFSFFQVQPKAPQLSVTGITAGQIIPGTSTITGLNVNATSPLPGITFTYQWISSCGGTFSAPTGSTTNFTAPTVASNTDCIITCKVTDNCGRTSISSFPVKIKAANPPTVTNDAATLDPGCGGTPSVTKNVLTNDIDPNGDPINLTQINGNSGSPFTIPGQGTVSFNGVGNVTFTAVEGFTGVVNLTYQVCDNSTPAPLCTNGTYAITVGDANKVPTLVADAATIVEDAFAPTIINVLANDIQAGGYTGGALSVRSVISGPANGRVSINPDNTITYIPNADFGGPTDVFTYEVVNASGYRRSATVTVTVTNNSCDAGQYEVSPATSGSATYQMSNTPVPPTTFGDAMIRQIVLALNNWGADTEIEVNADNGTQPRRSLVQFSLSGIPGGATITNAQLRLVRTNGNNIAQNIGAYRVNTAWNEGTGNNNANSAIINGSTWFTTSFTTFWQNAGGDFTTTDGAVTSVSTNVGGIGGTATYGWNVTTLTQGWYAGTFTNNGLILKDELENNGNDKVFASLNNATVANRPVLRVTYEVTPGVPVVLDIQAQKDTWIQHDENYQDVFGTGTGNEFQVNANGGANNAADRLLLKFNLSSPTSGAVPPSTSTITSSTLTLNRTGGDNTAVTIGVYQATNSWNEANDPSTSNTPALNGATWNTRNFTNMWNTPGGDFNLTPTSSQSVLATAAYNWDVLGIVQNWFNPVPAANHGFLVKAVTEVGNVQHEFASRQNATAGLRPTLVINYSNAAVCGPIPNRAPLANPDYGYTTNSITPIVISDVKTNDTDESALTVTGATLISGSGTVGTITANGFTFTPTSGVTGTAVVEYTVSDGVLTDVARVTIIVTNGPISATNDISSANSGLVQNISVMTNDADPENQKGVLSIVTPPNNGSAVVNDNGTPANFADDFIAYTPNAGFTGSDALTYQVCEALPVTSCPATPFCATATVNITVVNRTPVAVNDAKTLLPCVATTFSLVSNDTDPENGTLLVTNLSALSIPAAGTLTNNNDGTVTFLPTVGFLGIVTFTYTVTDNGVTPMVSAPATVTINVFSPVNNAPDAINDSETLNMDETNYANVRDNDTDPDGDDLRLPTITVAPLHGTAIVLENGLIQYTPNPGYYGTDVLTYQLCDSSRIPATCAVAPPLCDVATLSYTIIALNSVVAKNDENSTWVNTPVSGGVMSNDFDPEGDTKIFTGFISGGSPVTSGSITVSGVDASGVPVANAGILTINADGTYTFTPANNFIGVVTVPYTIADDQTNVAIDTAFLKITVNPLPAVTNSVITNNDENTTLMNTAVSSTLFGNDSDPQGNTFTATAFRVDTDSDGIPDAPGLIGTPIQVSGVTPTGVPVANAGTLTVNADGTYTFTPVPDFTGTINASYTITDALGAMSTAALTINILPDLNGPLNNPPVAGDDFAYTNINTPVSASFVRNDNDPNANPVSLNGTTIVPGGPKTAIGTPVTTAMGGTIQYFADGTYTYTPPTGYVGPDSVGYEICDVTAINPQPLCTRAFIHLLVGVDNSTKAINDETSTWLDVNVSGGVLGNDFDAENHTQTFGSFLAQGATPGAPIASGAIVTGVDKSGAPVANAGTLTFLPDGSYTFDPSPTFTGTVSVPYTVCDNGNLTKCDTAYLIITVDSLPSTTNNVIANNDENISYGLPVSGDLDVNDRDPQGNPFTVTSFAGGTVGTPFTVAGVDQNGNPVANAGTLVINADGTYTYTPAPGFVGSINVPYTITDALGATSTAILHIDVLRDPNGPLNDPPFAGDDFGYTNVNTPVGGSFIVNDNDPNANPVSLNGTTIVPGGPKTPVGAPVATAMGGTIQFYADGTYLYTPPAGYVGPDRVNYEICDVTVVNPQPLCNTATIHLLVGVDNSTKAINDETSTWQDVNVSGGVLANDFDAESHTQTFGSFLAQGATPGAPISSGAIVTGVDKTGAPVANAGTLTFLPDGSYTFDPDPNFTGTVSVPYTVCDNGNLSRCDTAYLTITIDPLPTTGINTVIANNDENISYGAMVGGSLFVNDRDPQNDAFTVTSFIGGTVGTPGVVAGVDLNGNPVANAGTLTINADGTYTFTPAPGFVGAVNVPYTITDANGATSTAFLHIDVLKDPNGILNDPPVAGDDFGYTTVNKPVTGSFISNDSDPNTDPVSYMGVTINPAGPATPIGGPVATAAGGTVQFFANGTYLYTPPLNYVGPDRLPYTICDVTAVAPQPLCADAAIHLLVGPGVNISGRVWDDANGNVNINGIETGTNAANTLYVNLVDGSGNVVATTPVASDGTYSFTNITPGVNYTIQLSTNQGTVGNPAPPVALPAGWVNTGENRNGTIDGGTLGVIDTRNYGYTNTINFDFGIERLPETQTLSTVITTPVLGQIITLNGGANPPVLQGSDPEDQPVSGVLTNRSVQISTIPANSDLLYNGVLVTAGQIIPNFDPALLTIQMTVASIGSTSTSFTYAYVDSAGKADPTPATYTLSWLGALPIDIVSFIAKKVNNTSVLNFEIAQPVQGSVFTIERSTTGGGFTAIGTLNSTNATGYTFVDAVPVQNAKNFYRIKETDARGQVSYSVIRMVKFTNDIKIEVYPVPASANINITLNDAMLNQPITLTLYNSQGQQVIRKFVNRANATETIDVQSFTNGVYQLRILNNTTVIAERKVVIMH